MIRTALALAGLIAGTVFGFALGISEAGRANAPLIERHGQLDAEMRHACERVGALRIAATEDSTARLWSLHGPTGIALDYVDLRGE